MILALVLLLLMFTAPTMTTTTTMVMLLEGGVTDWENETVMRGCHVKEP